MSRTFSMNCGSVDSLKVSLRWGCKPKARQIAADRTLGQPGALSERPRAPMRSVRRGGFQRQGQHALDGGIGDASRRAWTRFVEQSSQPVTDKPLSPLADGLMGDSELRRHPLVRVV